VGCKLAVILVLALCAAASPAQAALQSVQVRSQTIKALQAMNQDQWTVARAIIAQTKDPLASKLYYWMLFTREKTAGQFTHLAQFIRLNPDWPGIKGMRTLAEKEMPEGLSAAEVAAWFKDYPPETGRGMDRYAQALISLGKTKEAQTILAEWWSKTLLPREEQRDIYRRYGHLLTHAAHKKRFDTLLFNEQYTNARAIAGILGAGYPQLADARIALAEQKGDVNALINAVPGKLQNDPGLLYERLRWRRKNDMDVAAMEILHHQPSLDKIENPEGWWQERHIIIRRLLEQRSYQSAWLLAKDHGQKDGQPYAEGEWLAGWLALRFLNKPTVALQRFEALHTKVKTPMSKSRAAYWAGRAADAMKAPAIAEQWYREAAKFQTVFYGQLAGYELGLAQALPNAAPPTLSAQDSTVFNADEMVQAARLFHDAGMRKDSSRFLQAFVNRDKTPKVYRFAAEMAAHMEQYADAIRIAKEATTEGMFLTAQSYPVITEKLKNINTEWALVHALIRQESMFDAQAQSPAGALGLMQLMPGTAKETSTKLGIGYSKASLTTQPNYNIRLGSAYIDQMLNRFDGAYPLAIAAYNAGPGRVDGWVKDYGDPRSGNVDLIDWIEMIPIYETRNYVQRVMEGVYVYRLRLKGIQKPHNNAIHIAMNKKP
jgi:soluble lytic murein transglycosylase